MKRSILYIITILLLVVMAYSTYRVYSLDNDNKRLEKDIIDIKKDTDIEKENSIKYEEEKDKILDESKDKEEELKIWQKAQTKLEEALS